VLLDVNSFVKCERAFDPKLGGKPCGLLSLVSSPSVLLLL
jgi:hypothetical protein